MSHDHACGAPPYALAIDFGGKRVGYSGDTAWTEALIDVAQDADVFVCEAYFFEPRFPSDGWGKRCWKHASA